MACAGLSACGGSVAESSRIPGVSHSRDTPDQAVALATIEVRFDAMTIRLAPQLDAELRQAAEEDHRRLHQTIVLAIEAYLALRETAEIKADPETLRALAEARQAVQEGNIVYGTDAVRDLLNRRKVS